RDLHVTGVQTCALPILKEIGHYRRDGRGMVTSNIAECGGFLKTDPDLDVPDIQLHFSMAIADNHGRTRHRGHGFGCHVCLLRPRSEERRGGKECTRGRW